MTLGRVLGLDLGNILTLSTIESREGGRESFESAKLVSVVETIHVAKSELRTTLYIHVQRGRNYKYKIRGSDVLRLGNI